MNSFQALTSSDSNEWYTPSHIIEMARSVMGSIDLDPASCAEAQTIVKADRYFTVTDDGLKQPWCASNVWLNPPYGKLSAKFCEKLLAEHRLKRFDQAMVLVRGDSRGMELLFKHAYHCRSRRIEFTPSKALLAQKKREAALQGKLWKNSPVPGSTIFYFGDRPMKFVKVFCNQGMIFAPAINYLKDL